MVLLKRPEFDLNITTDASIGYCRLGRVTVVVYSNREVTDQTWAEFCEMVVISYRALGVPEAIMSYAPLIRSTANQRRVLRDRISEVSPHWVKRLALLSSSGFTRTAATALHVLFRQKFELRAFRPDRFREAAGWLDEVTPFDAALAARALGELFTALDMASETVAVSAQPQAPAV